MEKNKTHRGFGLYEFIDRYGVKCSIQKSSLATEDCIWFGCSDANPRICEAGMGWQEVKIPGLLCDTRMHLTQDQVKDLLPILQKFVETGEI